MIDVNKVSLTHLFLLVGSVMEDFLFGMRDGCKFGLVDSMDPMGVVTSTPIIRNEVRLMDFTFEYTYFHLGSLLIQW